jgi:hypothetical protein
VKRIFLGISLFFTVFFISNPSLKTFALTFDKLPISQSSQQWKIEIGNPDNPFPKDQKATKKFNEYSLDIRNIGDKTIELERIEVYRDEPDSKTKYELFTADGDKLKITESLHHKNLPVALSAKKLEVIITWSKKGIIDKDDRKYQETFLFETK